MSWSFTKVGKPSEIAEKVRAALASSRSGQANHAPVFDAIEDAVAGAVKDLVDENDMGTHVASRLVLVESVGHISSSEASATLSIKTLQDWTAKAPPAPINQG